MLGKKVVMKSLLCSSNTAYAFIPQAIVGNVDLLVIDVGKKEGGISGDNALTFSMDAKRFRLLLPTLLFPRSSHHAFTVLDKLL